MSQAALQKYHKEADLPQVTYDNTYNEAALVQAIKDAYKELRDKQKKHRELRISYLESLAEAIVLHHSPHLEATAAAPIRTERTQHQVKQLIYRENAKDCIRKLDIP